jgi:hypothetical protein
MILDMTAPQSITFRYAGMEYGALVRKKLKETHTEYRITIMNGELEKILYGHHIFIYKDGRLIIDLPSENNVQASLELAVAGALNNFIANNHEDGIHSDPQRV